MPLTVHQRAVWETCADLRTAFPDPDRTGADVKMGGYPAWWRAYFAGDLTKRATPEFPGPCDDVCCLGLDPVVFRRRVVDALEPTDVLPVLRVAPTPMVSYKAPFDSTSGYGSAALNNLLALLRTGIVVHTEGTVPVIHGWERDYLGAPSDGERRTIVHYPPTMGGGAGDIRYTVQEIKAVPETWVTDMNRSREIWTASDWSREIFQEAGVTVPVHVVPHSVDERRFRPDLPPLPLRGAKGYKFLYVAHWMERKNPMGTLRAYLRAFDGVEDVTLLVRSSQQPDRCDAYGSVLKAMRSILADESIATPPRVCYVGLVPPHQLPRLYASADCVLFPVRAEGFGIPLIEAMACGKPTITTDWPSMNQVAAPDCSQLVKAASVPVPEGAMGWARWAYRSDAKAMWGDPDGADLEAAMVDMYEHPERGRGMGAAGRRRFLERFSHERAGATMLSLLERGG